MRFDFLALVAFVAMVSATLSLAGCGEGGTTTSGRDSAVPCMAGMHLCGSECVVDGIDDPAVGCRKGCGTACPIPTGGAASCTSSGVCDVTCMAPYVKSGETCTCRAQSCTDRGAQCGMIDDGCGARIDCGMCGTGQACADSLCVCTPDGAEPNDLDADAFMLGNFPDQPDTTMSFDAFALQSADDVDFYRVHVIDAAMTNPTVQVELRNIPPSSDFDLGAWFACDSGGDETRCDMGVEDTSFGPKGCLSETRGTMPERVQLQTFCAGSSETGKLIIRVRSAGWVNACAPYELIVSVS